KVANGPTSSRRFFFSSAMRLRRSARCGAYSASGMMTDGSILRRLIRLLLRQIGAREDLDRMVGAERLGFALAGFDLHHLHQMLGGERAFGGDMAGVVLERGLRSRLADLDRHLEVLGAGTPDAAMAAAALDDRDPGLGDQAQHLGT